MNASNPSRLTIAIGTPSWQTGAAVPKHFKALADELTQRGHRVLLLVAGREHVTEANEATANLSIHVWPSRRPTRWADFNFARKLFSQHRPDIVLANFGAVNIATLAGWWQRVPVRIAWYHTMVQAVRIDGSHSRWRHSLLMWRKRLVYRLATHFASPSRAGVQDLCRHYGVAEQRCTHFYNPLADPLAHLPAATANPNQVICVGRFHPVKGQDIVLRAAQMLRDEFPALRFVFVGGGPLKAECENLALSLGIADRCQFVGSLPHAETLRQVQASAISLVPSRSDIGPLTVIEALACGTPVIATAVGGIPEQIDEGAEGFIVPPDHPALLAERIKNLLRDERMRQAMSVKARQRFLKQYELQQAVVREADWLEQLAAQR